MPLDTYGDATYGAGTYGGDLVPSPAPHIREKPPLRLAVDLVTPSGRHYRWSGQEPDPANVFSGLRHSSTMPGGYESCDCELPRKPGATYADLERLSTVNIYGPGVGKAGEYRLERAPRTSGDKMAVSPSAVGYQAHLDDDKSVRIVYVDIGLTQWGTPSTQRRLDINAAGFQVVESTVTPDATTGAPSLAQTFQGTWAAGGLPAGNALYDIGAGAAVGDVYFAWKKNANVGTGGSWVWLLHASDTDTFTSLDTTANLTAAGPGTGTFTPAADRRFVELVFQFNAAGGVDGMDYSLLWTCLAVYGDHGLTKRGAASATGAQGFYGSDIVAHAISTFAPGLTFTEGAGGTIQPSSFVIPQAAFLEPTTASEIVRQATRFGLQDWAVWDDKTFWWHERGAVGRKWRARIGPARLEETGPQLDRLWNSVMVSYSDVDGTTRTVGPVGSGADTEDASLQDDDPSNPANQLGILRRELLSMGTATAAGAVEVGARFLEQAALLDRSGRATLVGHVEDDRGVLHPYWRVRAGDTISFVDASDSSERRIVKAEHSYDTRSCAVDLDAPPEGLQALLERLGVVLVPLGI